MIKNIEKCSICGNYTRDIFYSQNKKCEDCIFEGLEKGTEGDNIITNKE